MILLWTAAWLLPMVVALVVPLVRPRDAVAGGLLALSALPALALGWSGPWLDSVRIESFLLGTELSLDEFRATLLTFTALLWIIAGWFSGSYLAGDSRKWRFHFFFPLTMAGNFGLIIAADVASFYAFFVLMTFASYGLVIHSGTPEARRAARIYIVMAVFGEVMLLAALFLAVQAAGTLQIPAMAEAVAHSGYRDLIIALTLAGFGVKAGAVPLYFWLPLAHPVAPTPASAILSGTMIKAGLLGWVHFLPVGEVSLPAWSTFVVSAGIAAALGAAAIGLTQVRAKTILAYSSISQMGIMTLILGMGLGAAGDWGDIAPVLFLYACVHGLAKGALFLGTTPAAPYRWARNLRLAGLTLSALVIAGAPLLGGFFAKYAVKGLAAGTDAPWGGALGFALTLSSLATALLLGKLLWICAREAPAPAKGHTARHSVVPSLLAVLAAVVVPFVLNFRYGLGLESPGLTVPTLFHALWPIVLAAVLVPVFSLRRKGTAEVPAIPPGDFLVVVEYGFALCRQTFRFGERANPHYEVLNIVHLSDRIIAFETTKAWVDRVESRLETWKWVGFLFLLFSLGIIILLLQ